jgi:hypothetical protein
MLAESHLTRRLFGSMIRRIDALAAAAGKQKEGRRQQNQADRLVSEAHAPSGDYSLR